MDKAQGIDAEDLLTHLDWLGVLARHLVSDQERAKDLVQDTCVVALSKRPTNPTGLRGWLVQVITNLRRQHVRSEERGRARDFSRARVDVSEATDQAAERVELQRELARLVLELEEPGRTVVLLRFYSGLPPREIAARLDVSVPVVQGRLQRALSRLRTRLSAESKWDLHAVGLLLLHPSAPTAPVGLASSLPIGALTMAAGTAGSSAIKIGVGATLILAVGVSAWLAWPTNPASHMSAGPASSQEALAEVQQTIESQNSREAVSNAASEVFSTPASPDGALRIHFRARTADGSWDAGKSGNANVIWNPTHKWGRRGIQITDGIGILPPKEEKEAAREQLDFDFVRLGSRRARALERSIAYPAAPELTVDCEYLPSTQLVVYDGPGQVHAKGLVLVEAGEFAEWNQFQVPIHWADKGPAKVLGLDLTSPITLEDRNGRTTYFVRSKSSAWSRITVDHETPGQRSVHLRPGGRVEFTVSAGSLRPETKLRIYGIAETPGSVLSPITMCTLTPEGHGFIDGLRVGSWEVRAELGAEEYGNPILGSQQFAVTANGTTQVTMTVPDPPTQSEPVQVRGEIVLPQAVGESPCLRNVSFGLRFVANDPWAPEFGEWKSIARYQMHADPAHPSKLIWDAGKITPGPWTAEISSVDWSEDWRIESGRENDFTIDLTHLQTLRIQVVDPESRNPVKISAVSFRRTSRAGSDHLNGVLNAGVASSPGSFELQLPEAAYDLEFSRWNPDARQAFHLPTLNYPSGYLEIEFIPEQTSSVTLSFRSSGMNIPVPMSWLWEIQIIRSDGQSIRWARSSSGGQGNASDATHAEFELDAKGPIELRFPPLDEFLQLPPMTAQLVAGEKSELVVELVPVP